MTILAVLAGSADLLSATLMIAQHGLAAERNPLFAASPLLAVVLKAATIALIVLAIRAAGAYGSFVAGTAFGAWVVGFLSNVAVLA